MIFTEVSTFLLIVQSLTILLCVVLLYYLLRGRKIHISKSHLETTFDSIEDPLAIISTDFEILRANRSYSSLVKMDYGDLIGKKCYKMLRGRDMPCQDCLLPDVLKSREKKYLPSSPHPENTEKKQSISITFYPFPVEQGSMRSIVEHIRDITELESYKAKLEQKNKSLSSTTSHLKKESREFHEELDLARQVQQNIFPQKPPKFKGLRVSSIYHPIEAVGGDLYDFIHFGDNQLGIFIGDASGHGLPAALISTMSKMSLYNHSKHIMQPYELLLNLNNDLIGNVRSTHYLTCFWSIFNSRDNSFLYSRAGHPMPVVIKANGEILHLNSIGTFAGILEKTSFEQKKMFLSKGDRCYLFTDGIFEVVDPGKKKFSLLGYKKFVDIIAASNTLPFNDLIPAIKKKLSAFKYDDDYTLVVFEVTNDRAPDISESLPGFSIKEDISFVSFRTYNESETGLEPFYGRMKEKKYTSEQIQNIRLALTELVTNALMHGNRNDPIREVKIGYTIDDKKIKVCVVDEGSGFNIDEVTDPTEEDNLMKEGGRGIYLVKKFADEIGQNPQGNGIYFVKYR